MALPVVTVHNPYAGVKLLPVQPGSPTYPVSPAIQGLASEVEAQENPSLSKKCAYLTQCIALTLPPSPTLSYLDRQALGDLARKLYAPYSEEIQPPPAKALPFLGKYLQFLTIVQRPDARIDQVYRQILLTAIYSRTPCPIPVTAFRSLAHITRNTDDLLNLIHNYTEAMNQAIKSREQTLSRAEARQWKREIRLVQKDLSKSIESLPANVPDRDELIVYCDQLDQAAVAIGRITPKRPTH